jgi:CheY-like chemotaxis protein
MSDHFSDFNIILAEDDEDDRLFFKEALVNFDSHIELVCIANGDELMRYLNNKDSILPHYIFLDINMPMKNGLECLREIKDNKDLEQIEIIMFSGSCNKMEMEFAYSYGARCYITKPYTPKEYSVILRKILRNELNR